MEDSKERQTEKRLQITKSPDLHRILAYIRASLLLSGEKYGYLINDANMLGKGKQNWDLMSYAKLTSDELQI